jgi:phosphate transport system substrate-binding protein
VIALKPNKNWLIAGLGMFVIAMVVAAGCLGGGDDDDEKTLSIAGSTTVLPVAQAFADKYMDDNSDVTITVSGGGSSVGVKSAADGTADIGMASREVKQSEMDENPTLKVTPIAKDGIAIIAHKDNTITGLTMAQVKDIYEGTITNWQDVGGPDLEIVIVGRDSASGTRATFEELVDCEGTCDPGMQEKASNGAVFEAVKGNENAIGYVGLGYVNDEILPVPVGGALPSVATVQDGSYPISRNLNFITDGAPSGLAKEFIDFCLSAAGQQIVEDEDFVPLS